MSPISEAEANRVLEQTTIMTATTRSPPAVVMVSLTALATPGRVQFITAAYVDPWETHAGNRDFETVGPWRAEPGGAVAADGPAVGTITFRPWVRGQDPRMDGDVDLWEAYIRNKHSTVETERRELQEFMRDNNR